MFKKREEASDDPDSEDITSKMKDLNLREHKQLIISGNASLTYHLQYLNRGNIDLIQMSTPSAFLKSKTLKDLLSDNFIFQSDSDISRTILA